MVTRKKFRQMLNEQDAKSRNPVSHKHGRYHQRTRLYGDYLWHQDRAKFEFDYAEYCKTGQ